MIIESLLSGSKLDLKKYRRLKVVEPFYYIYKSLQNYQLVPRGAEFIQNPRDTNTYYWVEAPRVSLTYIWRSNMHSFDVKYQGTRANGLYLVKHSWSSWPKQMRKFRINIQHVYHPGTSNQWNPALPSGHGLPRVDNGNENSGIYFNFARGTVGWVVKI